MIVGLTGGIGSGKTTVASIFHSLGIPVYEADHFSKNIIDENSKVQDKLIELLGSELVKNGKIDRPYMASLIFNDSELLAATNAIIHPAVAEHFKGWISEQDAPYCLREAAILFESGSYKDCDKVITITAPENLRIERVMARSNMSSQEVISRMEKQWSDEKKIKRSDFVIKNDGNHSLIKQVLEIHQLLTN